MKTVNNNRIMGNRSGSTLIEILVTIFVLTAGLFVLYGMFPQGFTILSNSKKINTASGLLQRNIMSLEMRKANMPFAIVPCDSLGDPDGDVPLGNGTYKRVTALNPNLLRNDSFERDADGKYIEINGQYQRGNLLRSRKVMGEKTEIPGGDFVTTGNGNLYGGKYTLLFSPIDTTRGSDGKLKRFRITGPNMKNIDNFASSAYPMQEIWNDSEYACYWSRDIDSRLYFAFMPSSVYTSMDYSQILDYDRKYQISYMIKNDTTGQIFKKSGIIIVKKDYDGKWSDNFYDYDEENPGANLKTLTDIGNGNTFLEDTLVVKRVFEEVTDGNFGRDPYQFIMADPVVGTIVFNPIGSTLKFEDSGNKTPLIASIDYLIYDPRIIVQDFQFPNNSDYDGTIKVRLLMGGILGVGNPDALGDGAATQNPDEPTFEGIIRGIFDSSSGEIGLNIGKKATDLSEILMPQSILMIDMATGLRVFPADAEKSDIGIDFNTGVISFKRPIVNLINWKDGADAPVYSDMDMSNRVMRVYFRTSGDWILKICKPPDIFSECASGANNYNSNVDLLWDQYGFNSNDKDLIYFPQSYSGMDVYIDYIDIDGNNIYGELHKISDFPEDNEVSCYIKLKKDADNVLNVRGAGANVGAFWRDGQRFKNRQMNFSVIGQ